MPNDTNKQDSPADPEVNRRTVLRGLAAGSAAIVGLSGTAAAEHAAGLDSAASVRAAFADHEDLLADLADRGLVEAATADELTLDPFGEARADGHERVRAAPTAEGRTVEEALLVRRTGRGWLTVGVRPAIGDRYAALRTDDGETIDVEPLSSCCSACIGYECCAYDRQLRCIGICQVCECRCA